MKFSCPSCQAKYQIAEDKLAGRAMKMKCRKCGVVIPITEESAAQAELAARASISPTAAVSLAPARPAAAPRPAVPRAAPSAPPRAPAPAGAVNPLRVDAPAPPSMSRMVSRAPSAVAEWHAGIDGRALGPMTRDELRGHLRSGHADAETLVWREGMTGWAELRSVPEVADLLVAPAPAAPAPLDLLGNDPGALHKATPPPAADPLLAAAAPAPSAVEPVPSPRSPQPRAPRAAALPAPAVSPVAPTALTGATSPVLTSLLERPATEPPATTASSESSGTASSETASSEIGSPQVGSSQAASPEIGSSEIGSPQVGSSQAASSRSAAGEAAPLALGAAGVAFEAPPPEPLAAPTPPAASPERESMWQYARPRGPSTGVLALMGVALLGVGLALGFVFFGGQETKIIKQTVEVPVALQPHDAPPPPPPAEVAPEDEPTTPTTPPSGAVAGKPSTGSSSTAAPSTSGSTGLSGLSGLSGLGGPSAGPSGDSPSSTSGQPLDSSQVQATVSRYQSAVKRGCWEPALASRDQASSSTARVTVSITVSPTGSVQSATSTGDPPGYHGLASCIERRVATWTFPRSSGTTTVKVPFVFAAQ